MQSSNKVFFGIALLSFLAGMSNAASRCIPKTSINYCNGPAASAAYTQANPGAPSNACGAACSASFIAINAANDANVTACNKAQSDSNSACSSHIDTCPNAANAETNACATMFLYTQTSAADANNQASSACEAAKKGTTACNAAWSTSYISCNVAHKTDYNSCNNALDDYVQICITPGTSASACNAAYLKAQTSCQSTAATAHNSCVDSATEAQLSC